MQPSRCLTATQGHHAGTETSPPAVQLFRMLPAEDAADAQATDATRKKRKVSVRSAVTSSPLLAFCSASWRAASNPRQPVAGTCIAWWPATCCLRIVVLPRTLGLPSWESRSRSMMHVAIRCVSGVSGHVFQSIGGACNDEICRCRGSFMLPGLRAELRLWTGTMTSPPCLRAGKACPACCLFLASLGVLAAMLANFCPAPPHLVQHAETPSYIPHLSSLPCVCCLLPACSHVCFFSVCAEGLRSVSFPTPPQPC